MLRRIKGRHHLKDWGCDMLVCTRRGLIEGIERVQRRHHLIGCVKRVDVMIRK